MAGYPLVCGGSRERPELVQMRLQEAVENPGHGVADHFWPTGAGGVTMPSSTSMAVQSRFDQPSDFHRSPSVRALRCKQAQMEQAKTEATETLLLRPDFTIGWAMLTEPVSR
jgi:hypothetical protein